MSFGRNIFPSGKYGTWASSNYLFFAGVGVEQSKSLSITKYPLSVRSSTIVFKFFANVPSFLSALRIRRSLRSLWISLFRSRFRTRSLDESIRIYSLINYGEINLKYCRVEIEKVTNYAFRSVWFIKCHSYSTTKTMVLTNTPKTVRSDVLQNHYLFECLKWATLYISEDSGSYRFYSRKNYAGPITESL